MGGEKFNFLKNMLFKLILLLNVIVLIIAFTPLSEFLNSFLLVNEKPEEVEVIVVLSGGIYPSGELDFRSLYRISKVMELVQDNVADKIICAGGSPYSQYPSFGKAMKKSLIGYGYDSTDIFVYDDTTHTYADICGVASKYKDRFDLNNALFVTSAFHTYRVKRILQKLGYSSKVMSADPIELYPNRPSFRLNLFDIVVREYMALVYSKIMGWI